MELSVGTLIGQAVAGLFFLAILVGLLWLLRQAIRGLKSPRSEGNEKSIEFSPDFDAGTKQWCSDVAELVADALLKGKVIDRQDFEKVSEIVNEEIYARLCVEDYPPMR